MAIVFIDHLFCIEKETAAVSCTDLSGHVRFSAATIFLFQVDHANGKFQNSQPGASFSLLV